MSIKGITDEELKTVLRENLTPSDSIKTRERLFGRDRLLREIDRALNSSGRQIFIYGDRGVGKSSLALTSAYLHNAADHEPIHVMCGRDSTFASVIQAIGNFAIPVERRVEKAAAGGGANLNLFGVGFGITKGTPATSNIEPPTSLNEALDVIRYVRNKRKGQTVIIVDEMERLKSPDERELFAEFIKNIPELGGGVRFIFCGIGHDVTELLQMHPSAGRILETINLERLHHNFLWQILTVVADKLGVEVQHETQIRIGQLSDGFPHYVHLIGESLFWSMFDDPEPVKKSGANHYRAGIEGALQRTEATLRAQYDKATKKYRNTVEYEHALWALADSTADQRQLADIYESSYKWIAMTDTRGTMLPRDKLNQRYHSLRKESHGRIVAGHGAGWFAYRENIMRGYVRLRAEHEGINLGSRHHNTAGME